MTAASGRWYWCTSCWKWHPFSRRGGVHHSMAPLGEREPDERNFEGTPAELLRFRTFREISIADAEEESARMEQRIDERLAGGGTTA